MTARFLALHLEHAAGILVGRLAQLEARLQDAVEPPWDEYRHTAMVLATILANLAPERYGALLTTAEMAAKLGVSPKTLLKRRAWLADRGFGRPAPGTGTVAPTKIATMQVVQLINLRLRDLSDAELGQAQEHIAGLERLGLVAPAGSEESDAS